MKQLLFVLCISCSYALQAQQLPTVHIDMHSHSALKPFYARNGQKNYSIWERVEHDCRQEILNLTEPFKNRRLYHSQANLKSAIKGNNRLSCQVLYPIERNYFRSTFYTTENILPFITCLWGWDMNARIIMDLEHDYFRELVYQIRYLFKEQEHTESIGGRLYSFKLLQSGEEVDAVLRLPNIVGGVLAVEGGHSLSSARYLDSIEVDPEGFEREVMANVDRLKGLRSLVDGVDYQLDVPVFYIRLANVFPNGLVGQALQIESEFAAAYGTPQRLNEGFSSLGQKVVTQLLNKQQGYRILVDVGGMSVESRKWYYQKVHNYHYNQDTVPIIATHVGISGESWEDKPYRLEDKPSKNNDSWLNHYQRNLARQDIKAIVASKGLIALSTDINVLAGTLFKEKLESLVPNSATTKKLMVEILVANMCKIIHSAQRKEAWDVICIGSNFDGLNQVLDHYNKAADFNDLAADLEAFFENPQAIEGLYTAEEIKEFMYGYSAEKLVQKIMRENALRVLRKHLGVGFLGGVSNSNTEGVQIKSN